MSSSITIADIYYQIQEKWQATSRIPDWHLAVWVASYSNVDIIDKFLEIECSPLGSCDEIFFRFTTEYKGDDALFIQHLWQEYCSWFTEELPDSYNVLKALKEDGTMSPDYAPLPVEIPTITHLWSEFLRLKSCIHPLDNVCFCIYFPPGLPSGFEMTAWFTSMLKEGIPDGIKIVTIDYKEKRKIKLSSSREVVLLKADFDMKAAINNEMDRECGSLNSTDFDSRYRKQVRNVLESTTRKDPSVLDREVRLLLSLTAESDVLSIQIATPLIISQAYFYINQLKESLLHVDKTLYLSAQAMNDDKTEGYPLWKIAMFQKASILTIKRERDMAIDIYEQVAEEAANRQDAFYVMEGYRMHGYLLYESGKKEEAFQSFLLSLIGGSHLEDTVRRASTYLYSASLALHIGKDIRSPKEIKMLEQELEYHLGDDWRELIENDNMVHSKNRRRNLLFGF